MSEHVTKKRAPDAVVLGQCAQCGGPVTTKARVEAASGVFCSEDCREKYDAFRERATAYEDRPHRAPINWKFTAIRWVRKLIGLTIVFVLLGCVALLFKIPVLLPFYRGVLNVLGW